MAAVAELFGAIAAGDFERVKELVTAEPSLVDARGPAGESAILAAVYHRQKGIANLLVARGATLTLFEAAAAGELEHVERFLDADASVISQYSPDGWTPLHLAAFFGHSRLVEFLLERGADPTAVSHNANANTPLHAALAGQHTMAAGLLVGKGADVNAADAEGFRPLHLAAGATGPPGPRALELLKALIRQGADVHATNRAGDTALTLAERGSRAEAAAFLKRHGA